MNTVYRAGSWYALIGPRAVVALPPDSTATLVEGLWARVSAEDVSFSDVVDALTAAGGGSFSAIPPFAAVVREGGDARIAVRGRVLARVRTAGGERDITGAEVTTWSERFVPALTGVEIRVEDGGEDPALPIVAGVVRVASVALGAAAFPVPEAVDETPAVDALPIPEAALPAAEPAEETAAEEAASEEGVPPVPEPAEETVSDASATDAPAEETVSEEAAPEEGAPPVPEPAEETSTGDTAEDAAQTDLDDLEDTVLSVPVPVETILPTADTYAAPLGGHTLDSRPTSAAPAHAVDGDHDGATISLGQARAMRGGAESLPAAGGPYPVQPESGRESESGPAAPVPAAPVSAVPGIAQEQASAAGPRIRLSSGQIIVLDRTVVIGRRPRATRSSGATLPHLVAVDSPQQDISRSHLEIRPEADAVVVLDLHTTNGSTLLRPGNDPVRLHPGEQTIVVTGDVIDLGDGVTVAFEELP